MVFYPEDILKIVLALLAGGLIGTEREFRDKAAGFRTMIFICLGAALFTMFSIRLGGAVENTRIAANVVVGVGFLGAGVIMRESGGRVTGLTTAATIWLVAALGVGIGGGFYLLAGIAAVIAFLVLWAFPRLEAVMERTHFEHAYEITSQLQIEMLPRLQAVFQECGLRARCYRQSKIGGRMLSFWYVSGPVRSHQMLMQRLLVEPDVLEFES